MGLSVSVVGDAHSPWDEEQSNVNSLVCNVCNAIPIWITLAASEGIRGSLNNFWKPDDIICENT